ncbi:MAG TPA: hypothetical protein PKA99_13270 [Dermatophilaceae bacterium]|jgi:hypothetical protein|nr:hypothetical protein [Dermatophilaceae bacterium]
MKKWQLYVIVAATAAGAATAGMEMLGPDRTTTEKKPVDTQLVDQLGDPVDAQHERYRQDGTDHGEANRRQELLPREVRPKLRIP